MHETDDLERAKKELLELPYLSGRLDREQIRLAGLERNLPYVEAFDQFYGGELDDLCRAARKHAREETNQDRGKPKRKPYSAYQKVNQQIEKALESRRKYARKNNIPEPEPLDTDRMASLLERYMERFPSGSSRYWIEHLEPELYRELQAAKLTVDALEMDKRHKPRPYLFAFIRAMNPPERRKTAEEKPGQEFGSSEDTREEAAEATP